MDNLITLLDGSGAGLGYDLLTVWNEGDPNVAAGYFRGNYNFIYSSSAYTLTVINLGITVQSACMGFEGATQDQV